MKTPKDVTYFDVDGKYSDYKSPRKRCRFVANTWQHLPHLLFRGPLVPNFPTELFCKQSPVYGVFWPLLPHPSTDRNETRTWSSLSPRNLRIKFGANPSTIFLVIVVTDRQTHTHTHTHKPTPVKTYSLDFAGIISGYILLLGQDLL